MKKSPSLYKLTGSGNDFILINCASPEHTSKWSQLLSQTSRADFAKKLCSRKHNIGADGLIFLEPSSHCDIKWDFYNSDGSTAEMCGNAARCVGQFCKEQKIFSNSFSLETQYGIVNINISSKELVEVKLKKALVIKNDTLLYKNSKYNYSFINSGVPHCVIETSPKANKDLFEFGQFVNQHPNFKPGMTNVSFYEQTGVGKIKGVSYERGVNNFTLACGTGAIAMGLDYQLKNNYNKKIEIVLPGGTVYVEFSNENSILIGPAKLVCEIQLYYP